MTGVKTGPLVLKEFRHFNPQDIETGQASSRPPVGTGPHCRSCEYVGICLQDHREGLVTTAKSCPKKLYSTLEGQTVLPFFHFKGTGREADPTRTLVGQLGGRGQNR